MFLSFQHQQDVVKSGYQTCICSDSDSKDKLIISSQSYRSSDMYNILLNVNCILVRISGHLDNYCLSILFNISKVDTHNSMCYLSYVKFTKIFAMIMNEPINHSIIVTLHILLCWIQMNFMNSLICFALFTYTDRISHKPPNMVL